ncbi:acetyl/propionyl/methylcrotonyl-CoA carboxylase subunit alpha [Corynebacterium renale]|uniref:biotin carboxylase n=1 Tax=Corynebacterium renale TaxID=1724 RepID=A0A2A9DSX4_9CORY|nr:biotin carboxylase N-terminal domain-containing protein [Corynebacterium renale]PFG29072.1 acetyl-CoA/propionyl-CoA carboxylase, biotin carboxylase, biotin carboxyl carrier protein [Corynebacterium renale]SQI25250.1 acyl-CoA carboxylase subunit alpha [Corynebacterium renale]
MTLHAVLIANRGEIAVRVARAARDLGIRSIAVYSEADAGALHTLIADEAYALPGTTSAETYMNVPALLDIAARAGADCVHPGYGFLSENADFARAVQDAGLTWIGPSPETIELLGDKIAARALATEVGAPLAPGTSEPIDDWQEARAFAREYGMPIAIKAAFGGGGRGLKVVHDIDDIEDAFLSAGREAQEAFGRAECYVEKFLTKPRHVEAQVLADTHGNVVVVGTRDCSTQRRFQKLVEEAPAPFLTDEQRRSIIEGARAVCKAGNYTSAGTVEFIVSEDGTVSFLEVNTRVQVEHPVTEAVTGVDIVAEQFRIADGQELRYATDPEANGHAFEFRINAEDVANGFAPCPGTITLFDPPTGPGIRVDSGVRTGSTIPPYYDSLMAKLVVWGPNREVALSRARAALREFTIEGVRSVLPFHRDIVEHPALISEPLTVYTDWVDKEFIPNYTSSPEKIEGIYDLRRSVVIEIDGKLHELRLPADVLTAAPADSKVATEAPAPGLTNDDGHPVTARFAGTVVAWKASHGQKVERGQAIATVEAMKMETTVTAAVSGTLQIEVQEGERFDNNAVLGVIV